MGVLRPSWTAIEPSAAFQWYETFRSRPADVQVVRGHGIRLRFSTSSGTREPRERRHGSRRRGQREPGRERLVRKGGHVPDAHA